jgi:hypothetical protein
MVVRATLHLYGRDIREGWPAPEKMWVRVVQEACAIIEDPKQPTRVVLLAFQVLLDADRVNLREARLRLSALIARSQVLVRHPPFAFGGFVCKPIATVCCKQSLRSASVLVHYLP